MFKKLFTWCASRDAVMSPPSQPAVPSVAVPSVAVPPVPSAPPAPSGGKPLTSNKFFRMGDDNGEPVTSVVLTFCGGSCYDNLYNKTAQVNEDAGQIAVYHSDFALIPDLLKILTDDIQHMEYENLYSGHVYDQFLTDLNGVGANEVVVNFECCSSCSDEGFGSVTQSTFRLTRHLLDMQCLVVFSDFSLKALIGAWDKDIMRAPCPFKKVGLVDNSIDLAFDKAALERCSSTQLRNVAKLSKDGLVTMKAMGGTIVFTASEHKSTTAEYTVEPLTLMVKGDGRTGKSFGGDTAKIGKHSGTLGHAFVKFAGGGCLLASAGHWVELLHINTSHENVKEVLIKRNGQEDYDKRAEQLQSASPAAQEVMMNEWAYECIVSSKMC